MKHRGSGTHDMPAVVVGLDCTVGLQIGRLLHAHGVSVVGLAADPTLFYCRTRCVRRVIQADSDDASTVDALIRLARTLDEPAVLCPATNEAVHAISRARDQLEPFYRMALPPLETIDLLSDKALVEACARRAGLRIPQTRILRQRAEAEQAARDFPLPGIIKPSVKTPAWMRALGAKALQIPDADALLKAYDRMAGRAPSIVLQQWIPGPDSAIYQYHTYQDRAGRVLVELVARKLRQWPPETGVASVMMQCDEPHVREAGLRLLSEIGGSGLSSSEFKRHATTGEFYYIETNVGRPALNMPVAEASGVPLHYTMYCDCAGLPLPPNRTVQRPGAKWISWRREWHAAMAYRRRGQLSWRDWRQSIQGCRRDAEFSVRDPGPLVFCLLQMARRHLDQPAREASSR
ncbi:MAG: hypothetical protein K8T26_20230 [Lentisphaerae bacterium]|nr:hypothetical protein [Lentisphaerota bacterium]